MTISENDKPFLLFVKSFTNFSLHFWFLHIFSGSTGSTGSESEGQTLHAGVCAQQGNLSTKDCNIAREALEILITCLQLRSGSLSEFLSLLNPSFKTHTHIFGIHYLWSIKLEVKYYHQPRRFVGLASYVWVSGCIIFVNLESPNISITGPASWRS